MLCLIAAEKSDQFLDQPQGGCRERLGIDLMLEVGRGILAQPDIFPFERFIARQQPEMLPIRQRMPKQLKTAHAEIRGRNVDPLTLFVLKRVIQHVSEVVCNVINDVGDSRCNQCVWDSTGTSKRQGADLVDPFLSLASMPNQQEVVYRRSDWKMLRDN